ncbi:MAG: zf-HC2 domain-containing protein [Opitutaceae bacterium]|nr:zf-HC2 domain-containing protein [Opitutaceae bacterium]
MDCRESQHLLTLVQDDALTDDQRATLEQHLTRCPACRAYTVQLRLAREMVCGDARAFSLPNVEAEIRTVQNRLAQPAPARQRTFTPSLWLGAPLAAAAVAFIFFSGRQPDPTPMAEPFAQVDYVVTGNPAASTLVYVDQTSGWLVVWASAPTAHHQS